jgi:hypothetical protein
MTRNEKFKFFNLPYRNFAELRRNSFTPGDLAPTPPLLFHGHGQNKKGGNHKDYRLFRMVGAKGFGGPFGTRPPAS